MVLSTITDETLLEITQLRERMYRFLSSVILSPPTPQLVSVLAEPEIREMLSIWNSELTEREIEHLDALKEDQQNLFVIPSRHYVAPFESVYRDTWEIEGEMLQGLLFGPSTSAVCDMYAQAGFVLGDHSFLPDFIGLEIAFMAELCQLEIQHAREGNQEQMTFNQRLQHHFLKEHLARWVKPLAQQMQEKAKTRFYQTIACILPEFVLQDEKRTTPLS